MKYIDPRRDPNKWIKLLLIHLIDEDTEESKEMVKAAIKGMADWLEPGLIDQLFANWIVPYCESLDKLQSTRNTDHPECLLEDPEESEG
jgi:hypothetical protein